MAATLCFICAGDLTPNFFASASTPNDTVADVPTASVPESSPLEDSDVVAVAVAVAVAMAVAVAVAVADLIVIIAGAGLDTDGKMDVLKELLGAFFIPASASFLPVDEVGAVSFILLSTPSSVAVGSFFALMPCPACSTTVSAILGFMHVPALPKFTSPDACKLLMRSAFFARILSSSVLVDALRLGSG
jgi:hypothetical protein